MYILMGRVLIMVEKTQKPGLVFFLDKMTREMFVNQLKANNQTIPLN